VKPSLQVLRSPFKAISYIITCTKVNNTHLTSDICYTDSRRTLTHLLERPLLFYLFCVKVHFVMKCVIFVKHGVANLEIILAKFDVVPFVNNTWFYESI
jgi:hypothetical protein